MTHAQDTVGGPTGSRSDSGPETVSAIPRSHLGDSRVLSELFQHRPMTEVFSDEAMLQSWLDAEVALVRAQESLGLVPNGVADAIAAVADSGRYDLERMSSEVGHTAHPLVPLIRDLAHEAGAAGAYVHLGATTQDITDTGLVIQARAGWSIINSQVANLISRLVALSEEYRDQPMVGRTHAQHALPITLGLKFAVLLEEFARHRDRLEDAGERCFIGQLGGAVGTLAALGPDGIEIQRRMMRELGLTAPVVPWHTARDTLTEITSVLAMISATCGKIANEIRVLQRTEVAELEEPFAAGKVGSSTMPHKRNPMFSEFILSNAILARQHPASMLAAMLQEHERDMSYWGVEWTVIPEAFLMCSGLLQRTEELLAGLIVHPENMRRNLHLLGDLMLSEVAMMALSRDLGKVTAHDVVYAASMESWSSGTPLVDLLLKDDAVRASSVSEQELRAMMVPEAYLGLAGDLVDAASTRARQQRPRRSTESKESN